VYPNVFVASNFHPLVAPGGPA